MNDIAIVLLRVNDAYLLGGLSGNAFHHLLVSVYDHITVGAVEPSLTFSCKVLSSQPYIPISCVSIHLLFQLSSPWLDGWVQQSCSYACLWSWIWLLVGGYRVRPLGKVTEQWMERDPRGLGQPFRTGKNVSMMFRWIIHKMQSGLTKLHLPWLVFFMVLLKFGTRVSYSNQCGKWFKPLSSSTIVPLAHIYDWEGKCTNHLFGLVSFLYMFSLKAGH